MTDPAPREEKGPASPTLKEEKGPTPDDRMSKEEKEAFIDKTEEFEGPDRREKRGDEEKHPEDPGVSHS